MSTVKDQEEEGNEKKEIKSCENYLVQKYTLPYLSYLGSALN